MVGGDTGHLYLRACAAIIGGLYWSRGTTAGAWAGMLTGVTLIGTGITLRETMADFPLNGMQISFFGSIIAATVYIVVSWLTCREPFNLDRMLHRGIYAIEGDKPQQTTVEPIRRKLLMRVLGIDQNFTRGDRWVTIGIFGWSVFWFTVFIFGSIWYAIWPWSDAAWASYWRVTAIFLPLAIGVGTTIWFTIGCIGDLRMFFRRLHDRPVDGPAHGTVPSQKEGH